MNAPLFPKKRKPRAIVVCGPTATGKTALAAVLADIFNGELISADSRQVYKGLDIVTGKDKPKGVKIWGYDVVSPEEGWSVSQFVQNAGTWIADCGQRGKLPIVVGGTGLYIKSLVEPIDTVLVPPNVQLRQKLESLSVIELQNQLRKIDALKLESMNRSDQMNPRRLIRAIEVAKSSSLSSPKVVPPLKNADVFWIGLSIPKDCLRTNITARVKARMRAAWQEEVKKIEQLSEKSPAVSALGYDLLIKLRSGEIDQFQVEKEWIARDLAYADRQMLWFKKQPSIQWFDPLDQSLIVEAARDWYIKPNGN